jgi:hypothetical protein
VHLQQKQPASPAAKAAAAGSSSDEESDDETFLLRHRPLEMEERQRFLSYTTGACLSAARRDLSIRAGACLEVRHGIQGATGCCVAAQLPAHPDAWLTSTARQFKLSQWCSRALCGPATSQVAT